MRSRLGISISAGTLDLIECGPAAEEGQSPHDHIPLYFIAAPSMVARRPAGNAFLKGEAEHDRTAHINGMLATSHPFRAFLRSNPGESVKNGAGRRRAPIDTDSL